ncbi:glycoside hydrolase family 127 protein [Pelagicoccus mobilis]|uniref:Glycoside hydrolase family 127 protein n=1 Tax=Pelagicoccus mobilis TaxID=415221 RepID=A0A934VSB8_9BACT|nr:glycoside hydrolase family 127 protein [Pelagicoccus mobilis]MBK1878344.1 glycoside hydrolase family 127 protein [Pelagicoccus mobilis]
MQLFHPNSVHLLEGDFKRSHELNKSYLLAHNVDRFLAPFLVEAGLPSKAVKYGNWESSGLDGHSAGHYLSALAFAYAESGDAIFKERLDYMINELALCQEANGDGYVGGIPGGKAAWEKLAQGEVKAERFNLNGAWVPWYNIHKSYAGLKDAWLVTGNLQAKDVLLKLCDWTSSLVSKLSEEQIQQMLYAEHGGMNDVFAEVFQHTGDPAHLKLAKQFSHHELLNPLLEREDKLTGFHANTQIPKVIGYQRIAQIESESGWGQAAEYFWNNIVHKRSIAIGGNSVREHFHDTHDFSPMLESREGPESCNTFNMLRLSTLLYQDDGDSLYIDYYERALFNHILSLQHPRTGGYVYFTPARPRHYRVYSQPETSFWCCVGTGMENPNRYTELIYAHDDSSLAVNLFISSQVNWKGITLSQTTDFPSTSTSTLTVSTPKPKTFALRIRKPAWADDRFAITINGKKTKTSYENGYAIIERKWKDSDRIEVSFPMQLSVEQLPDGSPYYAFLKGPIVLAARYQSPEYDLPGLFAGPGRMEHIAPGSYYPVDKNPLLIGSPDDLLERLTPIPEKNNHFTLGGDIRPAPDSQIELEPFYQIHDSRYTLYWRTADESEYAQLAAELVAKQKRQTALQKLTIDSVAPGQQQPEVEHDFRGEGTRTGILGGRQFRESSQWFGYTLKNKQDTPVELVLTYFGGEWSKACNIEVNGRVIGELIVKADHPDTFVEKAFPIPDEIRSASGPRLALRIVAQENQTTPALFDIALRRVEQ